MKKLGIITYFYYFNYGTMLQGFALQHVIEKFLNSDDKVELIDYRFAEKKISKIELIRIRIRRFFIYFTQIKKILRLTKYKNEQNLRKPKFIKFAKEYVHLTNKTYYYSQDLMQYPPLYDIYITGSDQTWSPKIGFNDALFLKFVPKGRIRAAYAPSIGVASLTPEEEDYLTKNLAAYEFLSCREDYGSKILSKLSGQEVTTVLDPTLLMTAEDWRKVAIRPQIEGKYILCYFLGDRQYYRKFVTQLGKQLKTQIYYIPVSYQDMSNKNNLLWEIGPREFLGLIDNASVVCTDSFHGMAFCTNLNKTFYGFVKHRGAKAGDNSRIYDFLDRMGLRKRLITEYKGEIINFEDIDFKETNIRLEKERVVSDNFLKRIIGKD